MFRQSHKANFLMTAIVRFNHDLVRAIFKSSHRDAVSLYAKF